jgi:ATP-dependent DNA helicase DinG
LKQGAGRLIRTEKDRGLLVIGDTRLMRSSYGGRLRGALPPMQILTQASQADEWVSGLASPRAR